MKIEPLIVFLSKTNDVRPFIDKFVDDNEILYREAMTFIKRYENNIINSANDVIDEKNVTEKDSDSENVNNNNVNHVKNQIYDYKINTLNMMKNVKFNLFYLII